MNCPHCESTNIVTLTDRRYRRRKVIGAILRCHRCENCRSLFISKQAALDEEAAADLLEML